MQGLPESFKVPYDPSLRAGSLVVGSGVQQIIFFGLVLLHFKKLKVETDIRYLL